VVPATPDTIVSDISYCCPDAACCASVYVATVAVALLSSCTQGVFSDSCYKPQAGAKAKPGDPIINDAKSNFTPKCARPAGPSLNSVNGRGQLGKEEPKTPSVEYHAKNTESTYLCHQGYNDILQLQALLKACGM